MYVKEIMEVKEQLSLLQNNGLILAWELPYENLLTRLSAAIFFLTPLNEEENSLAEIWESLDTYPNFSYRVEEEKKLSDLKYRITFSGEEKEKNAKMKSDKVSEHV